jgi:phosphatidylglycerophosphatase A
MENKLSIQDKACLAFSSCFGAGYSKFFPGTMGCLLAVPVFLLIKNPWVYLGITLFSLAISYPISQRAEDIYKVKDCKKIVIDDFTGMLITYLFIPHAGRFVISGFFLFRMFDMLKVPPADKLEKLHGAAGIVGDDLVAGLYANVILQFVGIIWLKFF